MSVEIEIGRLGTHTDAHGITKGFTPEFFSEVVSSYNPNNFRAPLIISHDTKGVGDRALADNKELAFGAPNAVKVVGDRLKAIFDKVSPKIVDHFRNGELLSVSPSFYPPKHRNNPSPGKWSLRHIAALGKTPPAIKGLTPIEMAEEERTLEFSFEVEEIKGEDDNLEFSLCDSCSLDMFGILSGLRDWLIEEKGKEKAEAVLPMKAIHSYERDKEEVHHIVNRLRERVFELEEKLGRNSPVPSYSEQLQTLSPPVTCGGKPVRSTGSLEYEQMKTKQMPAKKDTSNGGVEQAEETSAFPPPKIKSEEDMYDEEDDYDDDEETSDMNESILELQEHNSELEHKLKLYEVQQERMRHQLENAANERKLDRITNFCEGLVREGRITASGIGDRVLEFGEDEEAELDLPTFMMSLDEQQLSFMEDFLSTAPVAVNYGEFAHDGDRLPDRESSFDFQVAPGLQVSDEAVEEYQEIVEYCEQHDLDINKDEDFNKAAKAILG